MAIATVKIINRLGLHARAAAKFVQAAAAFDSYISIAKDGKTVNGKSIMGVMMLAAAQGSEIEIRADGADEEAALLALEKLVAERFGEPS